MRRLLSVLAIGAIASSGGCGDDDGSLLVVSLKTDFVAGVEFASVRTALLEGVEERSRTTEADPAASYLEGVGVAEFEAVTPGTIRMRVELLRADGSIVAERRVRVDYDGRIGVTVLITRSCAGVACEGGDATTCVGGRCVDPGCSEATPELCGEVECETAGDCPEGAACAARQCAAGACLLGPGAGACGDDEYCDPDVGCLARPTSGDGGVPPVMPSGQIFPDPDLTGDGTADLIARDDRTVYVFAGGSDFGPSGVSEAHATVTASATCTIAGALFRFDHDSDGDTDLYIGSICGGTAGVSILPAPVTPGSHDLDSLDHVVLSPEGWAVSGISVADLTGDEVPDLAASFPEGVAGSGINTGIVRVFFGLPTLGNAPSPDVTYEGIGEDRLGTRMAAHPGDVTGDGIPDLLVGAMFADESATDSGGAYLFAGPLDPGVHVAADSAYARLQGRHMRALGGVGTAFWDANLDGRLDLVVGSDEDNSMGNYSGRVFVFFGPVEGGVRSLAAANRTVTGIPPDELGTGLDASADWNGDGERDLLIYGCCGNDGTLRSVGNLSGVFARSDLGNYDRATVDFHYRGELDRGNWGRPSGIGDVNADGLDDFAAAFPEGLGGDGEVYVYFGRTGAWPVGTPTETADAIIAGTSGAARAFGTSVATR